MGKSILSTSGKMSILARSIHWKSLSKTFFFVLLFSGCVSGEWGTPTFAVPDETEVGKIEVTEGSSNSTLLVDEEYQYEEDDGFKLVEIKVTVQSELTIRGDSCFEGVTTQLIEERWYLHARTKFDHEDTRPNEFRCLLGINTSRTLKPLDVIIRDINDNSPRFLTHETVISVKELEIPADPIIVLEADDPDALDKGKLDFNVLPGEYFDINSDGEVKLVKMLNYSTGISHLLEASVKDRREPIRNASTTVTVNVIDIPNLPPQFTRPPTKTSITEHTSIGEIFDTVIARDGDLGLRWKIEFNISDTKGFFKIQSTDGENAQIIVLADIDADDDQFAEDLSHKFTIIAREIYDESEYPDLGLEETETTQDVEITIRDINDERPLLCENEDSPSDTCKEEDTFSFEIQEDHTGQVSFDLDKVFNVKDRDPTPKFNEFLASFAVDTPDIIKEAFSISPTRGNGFQEFSIVVKNPSGIDYERPEWYTNNGIIEFKIEVAEKDVPDGLPAPRKAVANITATIIDINDNDPLFKLPSGEFQYEFAICENTPHGEKIFNITSHPSFPRTCKDALKGEAVKVEAIDADITQSFGQESVRYHWSRSARMPPVEVDAKDGSMKIDETAGRKFDRERSEEEIFNIEAVDSEGTGEFRRQTAGVRFTILDVNDETVDLSFTSTNGTRGSVVENDPSGTLALDGIKATDPDLTADIKLTMNLANVFRRHGPIVINDDLREKMEKWFELIETPESNQTNRVAKIVIGELSPDREGYGYRDVDRVDLRITAEDLEQETGPKTVESIITVQIIDQNDNPPICYDGKDNCKDVTVENFWETVDWGEGEDPESDPEREIYSLYVRDPDLDTTFTFTLAPSDECQKMCTEVLELFELSISETTSGSTVLRRKKGKLIDLEERKYFHENGDKLIVTILTSDGELELKSNIKVKVGDINDNKPIYKEDYSKTTYFVREDVAEDDDDVEVVKIIATDDDHSEKYGKVSYIIDGNYAGNNGKEEFRIGEVNGSLVPYFETGQNRFNWSKTPEFNLQIIAVDDYKGEESSGTHRTTVIITVKVDDANNHAPEFLTGEIIPPSPLMEDQLVEDSLLGKIRLRDLDDPLKDNGIFTLEIVDAVKDPVNPGDPAKDEYFKLDEGVSVGEPSDNIKEWSVFAKRNFTGLWGNYTVTFKAKDGDGSNPRQLESEKNYVIEIKNANLHAPEFHYPQNETTQISISTRTGQRERLVNIQIGYTQDMPNIFATDKDKGSGPNGEVIYSIKALPGQTPECDDLFDIQEDTDEAGNVGGMVYLRAGLVEEQAGLLCKLNLEASDNGEDDLKKSTFRPISFVIISFNNTAPRFELREEIQVEISENATEPLSADLPIAVDDDIKYENAYWWNDTVYYFLTGEDAKLFGLNFTDVPESMKHKNSVKREQPVPILYPLQMLDREERDSYRLAIYATNDKDEDVPDLDPRDVDLRNTQWQIINVTVLDVKDTPPTFCGDVNITGGFSLTSRVNDTISRIRGCDQDLDEEVTFEVTTSIEASRPGVCVNPEVTAFELEGATEELVGVTNVTNVKLKFQPPDGCTGFFSFKVIATDSVGMSDTIECKMYMVTDSNKLKLYFLNTMDDIAASQDKMAEILTLAFSWKCNVDRFYPDNTESSSRVTTKTIVETHFIDPITNSPVSSAKVKDKYVSGNYEVNPQVALAEQKLFLADNAFGDSDPLAETDLDKIIMYILIGGITVLTISLLILATTCYFNNRGLSRRVRALTASAFGSHKSDLNKVGLEVAPNTNNFAVEGSNPIFTIDGNIKNMPDFDAQSVASGGSVLIGAEDEDYFQKSSKNPLFQQNDVVENYDSDADNGSNEYAEPQYTELDAENDTNYHNYEAPPPLPNAAQTQSRRNPLLNLGASDPDSETASIDVDGFGAPPEFEEDEGKADFGNDNFTLF